jgi:hypothetical protein
VTDLLAVFLSARNTILTITWLGTVLCAGLLLIAALFALLLRSRRLWGIAILLIGVDLLLAVSSAWLEHFGSR